VECKYCNCENCVKRGKTRTNKQRYFCKECKKTFILEKIKRFYPEKLKKEAMRLYFEGNSSRAVGRILKIGKETCLRWIKAYSNKIKPKNYKNERVEVIEMDELYSFISKKKTEFS
jgi:transposase-like protein